MNNLELMSSGRWHDGFTPEIEAALQRAAQLCYELNQLPPSADSPRDDIVRALFGTIGDRYHINTPFRCDIGYNIYIGHSFLCNFNVSILDEAPVTIGDNVFIGPNTTICTITHSLDAEERNAGLMRAQPISIGDNVWLGAGVTVMHGVSIGDGTVVGAGSLVTHDLPSGVLAYGSPCRVIRSITPSDKIGRSLIPHH